MSRSVSRFVAAFSASSASVILLLILILSSNLALALLPVVGIGGFYAEAERFQGEEGKVYPQFGDSRGFSFPPPSGTVPTHGTTDTASCGKRPMVVIQLQKAKVYGFNASKAIRLSFLDPVTTNNQWMVIQISQPISTSNPTNSAFISANTIRLYLTQLRVDFLKVYNVKIAEGGGYQNWGPSSDEFVLTADPNNKKAGTSIAAENAQVWLHAVTGQQITFDANGQSSSIDIQIKFLSTSELQNKYNAQELVDYDNDGSRSKREDLRINPSSANTREQYMRCNP